MAALLTEFSNVGSPVTLWYRSPSSSSSDGATPQPAQVQAAHMRLFLKTGDRDLYGRSGTLFWLPHQPGTPAPSLPASPDTAATRRFALSSLLDLRAGKQSRVLRSPEASHIPERCCATLASSQYELNLQFESEKDKDKWWRVIIDQIQAGGRMVQQQTPSPASSSSSSHRSSVSSPTTSAPLPSASSSSSSASGTSTPLPSSSGHSSSTGRKLSLHQSPQTLATILANGGYFRKFDLVPSTNPTVQSQPTLKVQEVICFTSGVGRAGLLHWIPAPSNVSRNGNGTGSDVPSQPLVPQAGCHIALAKISDILLKKKSPALKLPDQRVQQARDECCFALVTDSYTLSLEARSKEQRTQWQEGLIAMLTSAGRKLMRKPTSSSSSSSSSSHNGHGSPHSGRSVSSSASSTHDDEPGAPLPPSSTSRSHSTGGGSSSGSRALPAPDIAAASLSTGVGCNIILPSPSNPGQYTKTAAWVWFVESHDKHEAPGSLYWSSESSPAQRTPLPTQRFPLSTVTEMLGGRQSGAGGAVWRSTAGADVAAECAASIIGTGGAAWHLEITAPSGSSSGSRSGELSSSQGKAVNIAAREARDRFLMNIHSLLVRHRSSNRNTGGRHNSLGSASTSASASPTSGSVSPSTHSSQSHYPASPNSSVLSPSASSPSFSPHGHTKAGGEDDIRFLKEGALFIRHQIGSNGLLESGSICIWLGEENTPGMEPGVLYFKPHHPSHPIDDSARSTSGATRFPLISIQTMATGKETPLFRSSVASLLPLDRCLSVVSAQLTLDLESSNFELREKWVKAVHGILVRHGRRVTEQRAVSTRAGVGAGGVSHHHHLAAPSGFRPKASSVIVTSSAQQAAMKQLHSPSPPPPPSGPVPSSAASPPINNASHDRPQRASSLGSAGTSSSQPNPLSPNTPASPDRTSLQRQTPTLDHKSAVALLAGGQSFNMYPVSSSSNASGNGAAVAKLSVWVYFRPSNGADSPGTLHWVPALGESTSQPPPFNPSQHLDRSRIFYLNQIRQMRAGADTIELKAAVGVHGATAHRCLSLLSTQCVWNMEASSVELRDAWMKSLHQVLIRHGMKAQDDEQVKKANMVAAQQQQAQQHHGPSISSSSASASGASPSSSNAGGSTTSSTPRFSHHTRALPGRSLSSLTNPANKTINFSDPTDFFLLQSKIGEGSYGAVFKAMDYRDGKAVAIKVLQFQGHDSLKLRKEIHILKQCDSPYIVGYKGAWQKASNVWIVMEYCAGGSLSDIMHICQRTFSEAQVACIMKHALQGLKYLHEQKKIHRDIKGGNILVDDSGNCKLADFGVSSNLDKTLGKNRTVIGTPHWMAPEVLTSDDYDEKADIWSLGITAYELAIGEPPHSRLHSMRAAIKIPTSPPPTLPEPERFSPDFHSFIASCLVKDFRRRPSAQQLLSHPFIQRAPPPTILMPNVAKARTELESRHEAVDEVRGLMSNSTITVTGARKAGHHRRESSFLNTNKSSKPESTIDPTDFDFNNSDTMRSISDTCVPLNNSDTVVPVDSGTVVPLKPQEKNSNHNNKPPSSSFSPSDTVQFDTVIMQPSTRSPSQPSAAAASPSPSPSPSKPAAAADAVDMDGDGDVAALAQFDDEEDGEGESDEYAAEHEHDHDDEHAATPEDGEEEDEEDYEPSVIIRDRGDDDPSDMFL